MSFVDLHCHILPGLDDGSPSLTETVRFARRLDAENVLDVATTPHIKRTHHPFDLRGLARLRATAQRAIRDEGLRVTLHQGGELAHEDALTLDPAEILFVGDEPQADVAGPRSAGMKTVWVNRGGHEWPPDLPTADHEIADFHELVTLLTSGM